MNVNEVSRVAGDIIIVIFLCVAIAWTVNFAVTDDEAVKNEGAPYKTITIYDESK